MSAATGFAGAAFALSLASAGVHVWRWRTHRRLPQSELREQLHSVHYFLGSVVAGGAAAGEFLREDRQRLEQALRDFADRRLRDRRLKGSLADLLTAYEAAFALAPPPGGLSSSDYDKRITAQRNAARQGQEAALAALDRMADLELSAW